MRDTEAEPTEPTVDDDIDDELSYGCRELLFGFTALDGLRRPPRAAVDRAKHDRAPDGLSSLPG